MLILGLEKRHKFAIKVLKEDGKHPISSKKKNYHLIFLKFSMLASISNIKILISMHIRTDLDLVV